MIDGGLVIRSKSLVKPVSVASGSPFPTELIKALRIVSDTLLSLASEVAMQNSLEVCTFALFSVSDSAQCCESTDSAMMDS